MTLLTPRARLVADLAAPALRRAGCSGEAVEADPADVEPDLTALIEAAHLRVRGMRAAVVTLTGSHPPIPCAALRSAPGASESSDFARLWCLALEAVEGTPSGLGDVIARSRTPMAERMSRAYPGVEIGGPSGGSLHGEYTLYARGRSAVRQLAALLRTSIAAWPEPDWPAQVRRETFLREAFRAHPEGRTGDLRRLIDDFEDTSGTGPGTTG
ncbi:hypothetical protein [Streptomyces sp. NPDC001889]